MNDKILHQYQNGNVHVTIYEDGTKVREWSDDESPQVEYPESCDLKITQYCDLDAICGYCHEMSDRKGKHGDLNIIDKIWQTQKAGTELAIGGGNPLAHPDIEDFLTKVTSRGIIPNVTMNMLHMKKFGPTIKRFQENKLIYGLGISYRGRQGLNMMPDDIDYRNIVFHMILGIHSLVDCLDVIHWCKQRNIAPKILLLGYKTYGKGKDYYHKELQDALDKWKDEQLQKLFLCSNVTISFDNLAINQLDLQNQVSKQDWETLYQGADGNHTFYVDAVKGEVARTSTSDIRYPISENDTIVDIFNKVKIEEAY